MRQIKESDLQTLQGWSEYKRKLNVVALQIDEPTQVLLDSGLGFPIAYGNDWLVVDNWGVHLYSDEDFKDEFEGMK